MAKRKKSSRSLTPAVRVAAPAKRLLGDIRSMIDAARAMTVRAVNTALVGLYWHIGKRIREDILQEQRAEYGKEILSTVSKELTIEYGAGFSLPNLSRMARFAEAFPDEPIISALSKKLGWSHFVEIIPIEDRLKRDFYAEMCRLENWSTRTLRAYPKTYRPRVASKIGWLARRGDDVDAKASSRSRNAASRRFCRNPQGNREFWFIPASFVFSDAQRHRVQTLSLA